jgi:hypothetical protein
MRLLLDREENLDRGLGRLQPPCHRMSEARFRDGNALTGGKIGVRQVFAHNHNSIPPGQQPLQWRFVEAQNAASKVNRRVESVVHVAKAEGLPTPGGKLACTRLPSN